MVQPTLEEPILSPTSWPPSVDTPLNDSIWPEVDPDIVLPPLQLEEPPSILGAGRAAQVYKVEDVEGNIHAIKVFHGHDKLARIVHTGASGIPDNPYSYSASAIQCAHYRRSILSEILPVLFDDRLTMARSNGVRWNPQFKAFELDTQFISGRHAKPENPFDPNGSEEIDDLIKNILQPLQVWLEDAGFYGLVWQSGKGNPVAIPNFLLIEGEGGSQKKWCWIDEESGVPAPYPLAALKNHRLLFDDVDTKKLKSFLESKRDTLETSIGSERRELLMENVELLSRSQEAWRGLRGIERSLTYNTLRKETLSESELNRYREHPVLWYGRLGRELFVKIATGVLPKLLDTGTKVGNTLWSGCMSFGKAIRVLLFPQEREEWAREHISEIVGRWSERNVLSDEQATSLRKQLSEAQLNPNLIKFAGHLAILPPTALLSWGANIYLLKAHAVTLLGAIIIDRFSGSIMRTMYTGLSYFAEKRHSNVPVPWTALGIGLIPTLGNLAFPAEGLVRRRDSQRDLSKLVLYDLMLKTAKYLPILGGADSYLEHRIAHFATRLLSRSDKK